MKINTHDPVTRNFGGFTLAVAMVSETHTYGVGKIKITEKPAATFILSDFIECLESAKELYGELNDGESLYIHVWPKGDNPGASAAVVTQRNEPPRLMRGKIAVVITGCDDQSANDLPLTPETKVSP